MKKLYKKELLRTYVNHPKIKSRFSEDLLSCFELFSFKKEDFIIRQGYCSEYLYFIVEGKTRVYFYTPSGSMTLLSFCDSYAPVGDSASLFNKEAFANVEAITDGYCIGISLIKYRSQLLQDPIFLRHTCETLGDKLHETNSMLANVFLESIEHRLAYYIVNTCRDNVFSANLSECSVIMRTSYRHLLRVINTFCENELLQKRGKDYIILEPELLKKMALEPKQ